MTKKLIGAGIAVLALAAVLTGCIIVNGKNGNVYFEWDWADPTETSAVVDDTTDVTNPISIQELKPYQLPTGQVFYYTFSYNPNTINNHSYSNRIDVEFYDKGASGDLFTNGTNGGDFYFIVDIPKDTDALANIPVSITISDTERSLGSRTKANLVSRVVNGNTTTQVFDTGKARITLITTVK